MSIRLDALVSHLVREGRAALALPRSPAQFAYQSEADALINDIERWPQAFVLACLCNRQCLAKTAWKVPYELLRRRGTLDLGELGKLSEPDWRKLVREPSPIHRRPEVIAKVLNLAVDRLRTVYGGDASQIWSGSPPSATVVRRFLEFYGAGPKIATMAANILVRQFHVPLRDYHSIDVSVDRQIRRVMTRLGFVSEGANDLLLIYAAREAHAEFPGIFDLTLWNVGATVCKAGQPRCAECRLASMCDYAARHVRITR